VIVLALEGLRKLSDGALWKQRHELIDGVGRVILARVRSDDCVGRLTDDCFVVLLRRVDSALAQLIARKLLEAVERELAVESAGGVRLGVRLGVAGSGLQPAEFEALLERATALLADARAQQRPMVLDLPSAGGA
jgi:GGDEF domain-containing protein